MGDRSDRAGPRGQSGDSGDSGQSGQSGQSGARSGGPSGGQGQSGPSGGQGQSGQSGGQGQGGQSGGQSGQSGGRGQSGRGEEPDPPEFRLTRGGDGRVRRVRVRSNEIGARKRRAFLDHLAMTSNVIASARAAGASARSFHRLRRRDPEFAADWNHALDHAEPRLDGKLVLWAETRGKTGPRAGGGADAGEADDLEGFDPELALQILSLHRKRRDDRRERRGPKPRIATREEVDAAVLKVLKKVAARLARKGK